MPGRRKQRRPKKEDAVLNRKPAPEWVESYLQGYLDNIPLRPPEAADESSSELGHEIVYSQADGSAPQAAFFVAQAMQRDSMDIRSAWRRISALPLTREERRMENVAWRLWFLKIKEILGHRKSLSVPIDEKAALEKSLKISLGREFAGTPRGGRPRVPVSPVKKKVFRQPTVPTQPFKEKQLYIVMISLHGLVRGENMELGRDPDTGGQIKYVVELAQALAAHPSVWRVDLLTRLIRDPSVDASYAVEQEALSKDADGVTGAYIRRIECGPDGYFRKEVLWPFIEEFADNALRYIMRDGGRAPFCVHSHYADAGEIAARLCAALNVPHVHTGHSLGRNKKMEYLEKGFTPQELNEMFAIDRRIEAEERTLESAEILYTSTTQEINEQWARYHGYLGSGSPFSPETVVNPPGIELKAKDPSEGLHEEPAIWGEIKRFLASPYKPCVLALCRPDQKKNMAGLLEAYGNNKVLQELANLVLVLGNRDDINEMGEGSKKELTMVLTTIDKYSLYGKVAYPKHHQQSDVPFIYLYAAKTGGVFVNCALVEPFGLTVIEAAAAGVPVVATKVGGPVEILANLKNGLLVNPRKPAEIGDRILRLLTNREQWTTCQRNGLANIPFYSWTGHVTRYLETVSWARGNRTGVPVDPQSFDQPWERGQKSEAHQEVYRDLSKFSFLLATDVDNTLIGGSKEDLEALMAEMRSRPEMGFGVVTGRTIDSACEYLRSNGVDLTQLSFLLTSVGSEIYYVLKSDSAENGVKIVPDEDYARHINFRWNREAVRQAMEQFPALTYQTDESTQRTFKVSYDINDPENAPTMYEIKKYLRQQGLPSQLIYSHGKFVDILPVRASKGLALLYVAYKFKLPVDRIVTSGDSGNDETMMRGRFPAIVVGNYSPELEELRSVPHVFFAKRTYCAGIIEGLRRYTFLPGDERLVEQENEAELTRIKPMTTAEEEAEQTEQESSAESGRLPPLELSDSGEGAKTPGAKKGGPRTPPRTSEATKKEGDATESAGKQGAAAAPSSVKTASSPKLSASVSPKLGAVSPKLGVPASEDAERQKTPEAKGDDGKETPRDDDVTRKELSEVAARAARREVEEAENDLGKEIAVHNSSETPSWLQVEVSDDRPGESSDGIDTSRSTPDLRPREAVREGSSSERSSDKERRKEKVSASEAA